MIKVGFACTVLRALPGDVTSLMWRRACTLRLPPVRGGTNYFKLFVPRLPPQHLPDLSSNILADWKDHIFPLASSRYCCRCASHRGEMMLKSFWIFELSSTE